MLNATTAKKRFKLLPRTAKETPAVVYAWKPGPHSNLCGLWFHTFHPDGQIKYQGQVMQKLGRHYLVQYYNFTWGEPSNLELVPFKEMLDWHYYLTSEDMRDYWQQQEDMRRWDNEKKQQETH